MTYDFINPVERPCWRTCGSCFRCADKGRYPEVCNKCSGRFDPDLKFGSDPDDFCQCTEGILRWKTQNGKLLIARIPGNPFASKVQEVRETADEREYKSYLYQMRNKLDNPNWSPVRFENGLATEDWYDSYKKGKAI